MGRPRSANPVVKKAISLPPDLSKKAERNARRRARSFSSYVAWLILRDNEGDGENGEAKRE